MTEPSGRDREAAMQLALAFTRYIEANELTIDFWSECDGEGCLSTVALPFLAAARAEGRREAIGECANGLSEAAVDAAIEAASNAVKGWNSRDYTIAETAARAAVDGVRPAAQPPSEQEVEAAAMAACIDYGNDWSETPDSPTGLGPHSPLLPARDNWRSIALVALLAAAKVRAGECT